MEGGPLDIESANDLRRTHTLVARLAHAGVTQEQLEHVLCDIYKDGNDVIRSALRQSNEALLALGYSVVRYPDMPIE